MKKYLLLTLVCFSMSVFASGKNEPALGQVESSSKSCEEDHAGCGPCIKLCQHQRLGERSVKDSNSSQSLKAKSRAAGTSKQ